MCREGASTMNRDNPLYESQEIRMEMFADIQSDEDDGKLVNDLIELCSRTCLYCGHPVILIYNPARLISSA